MANHLLINHSYETMDHLPVNRGFKVRQSTGNLLYLSRLYNSRLQTDARWFPGGLTELLLGLWEGWRRLQQLWPRPPHADQGARLLPQE